MKRLGVFLLNPPPPAWFIKGLPHSIKYAGTHLYTGVERGTVRVKCLVQEHKTMLLARAQTLSAHPRVKRTDHEATPPTSIRKIV